MTSMLSSVLNVAKFDSGDESQRDRHFQMLKESLHKKLIGGMDLSIVRKLDPEWLHEEIRRGAEDLCKTEGYLLSTAERARLVDELIYETLGFGPLEPLLADPTVSDILINGPHTVYVERRGQLERTNIRFRDLNHLLGILHRIANRVGRRIDESSPMVDARLPDGGRLNASFGHSRSKARSCRFDASASPLSPRAISSRANPPPPK